MKKKRPLQLTPWPVLMLQVFAHLAWYLVVVAWILIILKGSL